MNPLKPYSYLYKRTSEPSKLISCFVILVPSGKSLTGPAITTSNGVITVKYSVITDTSQTRDRQEEYEKTIDWNGVACDVKVVVGDGSGSGGGSSMVSSNGAENL